VEMFVARQRYGSVLVAARYAGLANEVSL